MAAKTTRLAWFGPSLSEADFEAIYRAELPRLYRFFCYRVGEGALAEDLTSTTFEKAWRGRGRFRQDAAFSTWLFSIARRVAQDYYRRQQKRSEVPLEELSDLPEEASLEDAIQKQADFAHLSILLARLADRERELVALKYGAGLTNRHIAQLSGLSETNVGVILHRALQKLRSAWETHL